MKRTHFKLFCTLLLVLVLAGCQDRVVEESERLVNYVDPFIGTGGHGHTYPGAALPFGMVQLSPDNGTSGWDWSSGYHISDSIIAGFSHLHLSGTGIGDLADISVLPVNTTVQPDTANRGRDFMRTYWSRFKHESEKASPGYYKVYLDDPGVTAELTTSLRTGFHRYRFHSPEQPGIVFDLGFTINWDRPADTKIQLHEDGLITGYRRSKGWAADQIVYFAARFDTKIKYARFINQGYESESLGAQGQAVTGIFTFPSNTDQVLLKLGLSTAGIDGAIRSLEEEITHWDFDKVRSEAEDAWETRLQKVTVKSGNEDQKTIFYTAMYHALLAPALYSDLNGEYTGPDKMVHKTQDHKRYTVFSLWDTFRAAHPLFTILCSGEVPDMVHSMLSFYRESGLLPVWELEGNETSTMIGYHAIPVITDAILKGIPGFDHDEAFKAMKKSSMQDIRGLRPYRERGYIPAEMENESVSKTLEYAYDDWCIAAVAKALGKEEDYSYYMKRAAYYQNHFDRETQFMRGKLATGEWRIPFDPLFSHHRLDDYTEGNAWQYTWFVPHDVEGLIRLFGGREAFVLKLDSLFSLEEEVKGDHSSPDISGLIGQYAHGNEPGHHVAYLYNYAGQPWKTQAMVRRILTEMYKAEPDGLSGNEDCGQMSAWYILSAMGFYPVNPADGLYVLGSPLFDEVVLNTGKTFRIVVRDNSDLNMYIQKATLNGKPLNRSFISHQDIIEGGLLEIEMGPEPNTSLWVEPGAAPPSMSREY